MNLGDVFEAFFRYVKMGGYVMPPLILATVLLWFALGVRVSVLRRGRNIGLRKLVALAKDKQLGAPRGVVEVSVMEGVELFESPTSDPRSALDETFSRHEQDIAQLRTLVTSIVAIAPLLGLLGTVSGMIETFSSLGDMTLYSQSGGIASGISQALLTTQFGLAIAIPGLIINGLLNRRQRVLESQIEEVKHILCELHASGAQSG